MTTKTAYIGIRLPVDLLKKIDRVREESERTRSFLIRKAAELFINEYEDNAIALSRLQDTNDPVVPWEEIKKRVR